MENSRERTYRHSGDLGDIIYALPTVKALGGGKIYLDPEGGKQSSLVSWCKGRYDRTHLNKASIDKLTPLLLQQEYVSGVYYWSGEKVDYDLDRFRAHQKFQNLSDSHLDAFGLPFHHRDDPWLTIDGSLSFQSPEKDILLARSPRVQSNHSFWEYLPDRILERAVFVGNKFEYEIFEYTFGFGIPFWDLNIIDLARAINSSSLFISNQTLGSAIAEGFKKKLIQEVYRVMPMAIFKREGATYV